MLKTEVFSIPCVPFQLELSKWDQRFPSMYSKRILCFPWIDNTDRSSVISTIHEAYELLIQELPFLAGSVTQFPESEGGAPWLRKVVASGGAKLIVKDLSDEIDFADLRRSNFSQDALHPEVLCPFDGFVQHPGDLQDVCRFQANLVKGGLLLVISIVHVISDGVGIWEILRLFAAKCQEVESQNYHKRPVENLRAAKRTYSLDRSSIVSGQGVHGAIERHPCWNTLPMDYSSISASGQTACRTFRISRESLLYLKQLASAQEQKSVSASDTQQARPLRISTHDAIIAFMWRSILTARHHAGVADLTDEMALLCLPVDFRSRICLPKPYYGNAIDGAHVKLKFADLAGSDPEKGMAAAMRAVRTAIDGIDKNRIRDLLGYVDEMSTKVQIKLSVWDHISTSGVFSTSYWGMDHYNLEFGNTLGRIEAFRLPRTGAFPGMSIVLPPFPGGAEIMISEATATMDSLKDDHFFTKHASPC